MTQMNVIGREVSPNSSPVPASRVDDRISYYNTVYNKKFHLLFYICSAHMVADDLLAGFFETKGSGMVAFTPLSRQYRL